MPLKALEGVQRALSHPDTARWGYFVIAVGLFVVVFVLATVLVNQWQKRRRVQEAWARLARDMARWRLDRTEQTLLRALATREAPDRPLDVVERIEVFEKAVHRYLASLGAPENRADSVRQVASVIAGLRQKLSFVQARGRAYYSSREMSPGQAIHLARKGRSGGVSVWARVIGGREEVLPVERMQPADADLQGRTVEVVFFDGKAAFSFDSAVLAVDADEGTCLLAHSINVHSAGAREFHRVEVNRPVAFRAAWEEPDVRREGVIMDLSAGGLALLCPCYYEDGEEVLVHLQPSLYLRKPNGPGLSHVAERQIKGVILQTRRTADGRGVHHIEFRDVGNEDREYLFHLIRRIEVDSGD